MNKLKLFSFIIILVIGSQACAMKRARQEGDADYSKWPAMHWVLKHGYLGDILHPLITDLVGEYPVFAGKIEANGDDTLNFWKALLFLDQLSRSGKPKLRSAFNDVLSFVREGKRLGDSGVDRAVEKFQAQFKVEVAGLG